MAQTVTVADFSFTPNSISITAGQTVTWTWGGGTSAAHNVDSGSGCTSAGLFSSGATQTSGSFGHQFTAVGTYNYFCDPHCTFMTGSVTVNPGAATHLAITSAPGSVTAGNSFSITVTAFDAFNNVATGFGGTVSIASSDGQAVLPAASTLVNGQGTFNGIVLKTAGFQSIVASASGVSSSTVFINVGHAAANHFLVSAPASVTAGTGFTFTVTAQDPFGNTDTGFVGTVSFSSTDPQALLPGPSTLSSGTGTFGATLKTSGSRTITATSGAVSGTSNAINVIAGAATHYTISAPPTVAAGASFSVTVTALDTFNNIATGYGGTVHFTSSDGTAVLPANSGLINGTSIFAVTLNTQGSQSITATDTVSSGITATANVVVSPPCPAAAKTFSNSNPVQFSTTGAGGTATTSPYPSTITVSGMSGQVVGKLTLTLKSFSAATCPADLALMLQGPQGQFIIPMSLVGPCITGGGVSGVTLTLDDAASSQVPAFPGALSSGTFKPSSYIHTQAGFGEQPIFPSPAPAGPYTTTQFAANDGTATFASVFNGTDPNGTWNLYVVYQPQIPGAPVDNGQFAGGWSLTITPQQSFSNSTPISFTTTTSPSANPYPSPITVAGLPGNISKMSLTLNGLTSTCPPALALLLQGPTGQNVVIMNIATSCTSVSNVTFSLDDAASTILPLPGTTLTPGTYQPASYSVHFFGAQPMFPPSAPAGPYPLAATDGTATLSSIFNGTDPNGTWNLYVQEQTQFGPPANSGQFAGGWSLAFQTDCPVGTSSSVISSANPSVFGQPVTFTATITSAGGTPFGTVTFKDGATTLGTGTLSGSPAIATFTSSALAVGSHNITAVYGGNTSFATSTSAILTQTVNQAATVTARPSSSANPSIFGNAVTFTSAVAAAPPGAGTPSGTVTFMDGVTAIGSGVLAGGIASYTTTLTQLVSGGHSITAAYSGDANFTGSASSTLTQTVNQAGTSVGLSTSATPSVYGLNVTFKAAVASSTSGTPTGTVTFKDGGTIIGAPVNLVSGIASITTNTLTVSGSPHSITAVYNGDTNFTVSSSSVPQNVTQASTGAGDVSSANPSVFGQAVTFTATVTDTTTGSTGTPTGAVTFSDGATVLGTGTLGTPAPGSAAFIAGSLSVGSHAIHAVYGGDTNFTGSSAAIPQIVNQAATTISVNSSASPTIYGLGVTFTAHISVTAPGAGSTSGTVTFKSNGVTLGTGTVSGNSATFNTTGTQLTGGSDAITVFYGGDGNFTGSDNTSSPFTQVVNRAGSTTTVSSSSPSSTYGQSVTFTATVSNFAGGVATGTVTFKDGSTTLGTGTLSGSPATAAFTTTSLPAGSHSITAAYGGDTNFNASSSSPPLSHPVSQASTLVTLTPSLPVSIFRQPVTLNVSVTPSPPSTGTPTGMVTFMDGSATLGTGTLSAGNASMTVSGLAIGYHTLTVVYGGDANFTGVTSLPVTHRRSPVPREIPNP